MHPTDATVVGALVGRTTTWDTRAMVTVRSPVGRRFVYRAVLRIADKAALYPRIPATSIGAARVFSVASSARHVGVILRPARPSRDTTVSPVRAVI